MRLSSLWSCILALHANVAGTEAYDQEEGPVIGIDLGTTYSCVGIFRRGRVEIIANEQGNRITPSYVAFTDDSRLIGEAAKNQATLNPPQTLFDVKRLIGRRFVDDTVQQDMLTLPYELVDEDGKPMIRVKVRGEHKIMSPEEVSSMILMKMKDVAETYLGNKVKDAVITVPAYFNNAQRQATKDAGAGAGLNVLRILSEPTAAALAYGLDGKTNGNILVYDLGGGTFDVSILTIDQGVFEVLATSGDTHLGGEDFDRRVMWHFIKIFKDKHGADLSQDKRSLQKLRNAVEKAKRGLSTSLRVPVEIEALYDGIDFSEVLTRAKFEEINLDLFKKTLAPVDEVMASTGLKKNEIDELVLVGGSTRIPKIQELMMNYFGGKKPNRGVNPDEAVAYGAAVQAGIMSGDATAADLTLVDVAPLTLGVEVTGGRMAPIINRNSRIPTLKSQMLETDKDYQTEDVIAVYEGERPFTRDNYLLGEFKLTGIPPDRKGMQTIEVTYELDSNGILDVTAEIKTTKKSQSITIQHDRSRLTEEKIQQIIKEAAQFAAEDKLRKERSDAMTKLTAYVHSMSMVLQGEDDFQGLSRGFEVEDKSKISDAVAYAQDWIAANPEAELAEIEEQYQDVLDICGPILVKYREREREEQEKRRRDQDEADDEIGEESYDEL